MTNSVAWVLLGMYVAALITTGVALGPKPVHQRYLVWSVFLVVVGGFADILYPFARIIGYGSGILVVVTIALWTVVERRRDATQWMSRSAGALILRAPFRGTWYVASTRGDFAYDFCNDLGPSWDQPILAPCRGLVAHVEDGHGDAEPDDSPHERKHPLGNYISIETPRGYVLLAHLRRGSITVRAGATVGIGEELARCGNSGIPGATKGAHLHVVAQKTAFEDEGVAATIPIAFIPGDGGEPLVLENNDRLS